MRVGLHVGDGGFRRSEIGQLQTVAEPIEQAAAVIERAAHRHTSLVDAVRPQTRGKRKRKVGGRRPARAFGTRGTDHQRETVGTGTPRAEVAARSVADGRPPWYVVQVRPTLGGG